MGVSNTYLLVDEDGDELEVTITHNSCGCSNNNCNESKVEYKEPGDEHSCWEMVNADYACTLESIVGGDYVLKETKRPHQEYSVDEQLVSDVEMALATKDRHELHLVTKALESRLHGVCFCMARSSSDCFCGAHDGVWDA